MQKNLVDTAAYAAFAPTLRSSSSSRSPAYDEYYRDTPLWQAKCLQITVTTYVNFNTSAPMEDDISASLDYFNAIVASQIPESLTLEYKASAVLVARDAANTLCKTVSAFANSVGGRFLIGIASQNSQPTHLDGGVSGPSKRDWIHTILNSGTFPPVETVNVSEFRAPTGSYYIINVGPSPLAPHQSSDNKYYKRRGTHSEPMEHYEIEDVRSRPKRAKAPLRVELLPQAMLAFLHFRNEHQSESVTDVKCRIESNFKIDRPGIDHLSSQGIRQLRPQAELHFLMDSFYTILSQKEEAELKITINYKFQGSTITQSATFYFADFNHASVIHSPIEESINTLTEKIEKATTYLSDLHRDLNRIARIADGTGLRLSTRTIQSLRNAQVLFDPLEFDWQGYTIVCDISNEEALLLDRIFHTIDTPEHRSEEYQGVDRELRQKFETHFRVDLA